MTIPALRDPNTTFEQKVAYLNYLWSLRRPEMIDPNQPVAVYAIFGVGVLKGINRYTGFNMWQFIRPWAGSPFGPMKAWDKGLMAWA
jgi:hypothetical protein